MCGQQYDFDEKIDRKNTDSLKYDFAERKGMPSDILPLWVADMDFRTSNLVLEELHNRVEHGIFGYTESGDEYFQAVRSWMNRRHGWDVERRWLVKTPGIVYALAMAVQAYTEPGDAVLIQQPVYYPFLEVITNNDREPVNNSLVLGDDGIYHMDLADFERKVVENKVKLFLLCSPHNPVSRVWTVEELAALAEICIRHDVIVVSDEIHQDFVFDGHRHHVFATVSEELKQRVVICTSPSKTFNLAGLQVSNIFIPDSHLRHKFKKRVAASGYSQLNTLGLTACQAAYQYGEEWLEKLKVYLKGNLDYLREFIQTRLPGVRMIEPEGTYLIWVDFRGTGKSVDEINRIIVNEAKLWLDSGELFGASGEGFQRINIACLRSVLEEALESLAQAFCTLESPA